MNWAQELKDLYDKNEDIAGKIEKGRFGEQIVLLPIFHTTVIAHITVGINIEGEFQYANPVMEEDKMTIIPVTEKSAARTAGVEPHPLCDNLKYLAGDYMEYVVTEKGKDYSENHELYIRQLEQWVNSDYQHEKVSAIWRYLQKKTLMKDLIHCGILKTNEAGKVCDDVKFQKVPQTECFVRFIVEKEWDEGRSLLEAEVAPECWRDKTLVEAYIAYCKSWDVPRGLSYLSGKTEQLSYLHPKKIRNEGDGAKLISANDTTNFTFRGRFVDREEAFTIGYEDSQKIHNALKWIIRSQGRNWNGLTVVTWQSDLQPLPDWSLDTDTLCDNYQSADSWNDEEEETYEGTNPKDASRFSKAIEGYGKLYNADSRMVLMALDAATQGRLNIMEYESLASSTFLSNLKCWHETCGWIIPRYKDKTFYEYYGVISVKDIANLLYGVESNGTLVLKGTNEKMSAEVCKRLIPCIILKKKIPEDMVQLAYHRASSPMSFESQFQWRRMLALACALIKKKYAEQKKEVWTVALDKNCQDRNYLYGRLLAIADRIEYRTFEKGEERQTNAMRHMNAFSQQPFRTWKVIEERIQPYYVKLAIQERLAYSHLIDEICEQFETVEAFEKNDILNGLYLLGFHNQAYALRNKAEEDKEDE